MKYFIPLEADNYYHIFNRAIGNEKLFKNEPNYLYFLKRFKDYISPIANVYSYVLMPNHFHFLIEVKSKEILYDHYNTIETKKEKKTIVEKDQFDFNKFVMQQFSNFFNSYSKAFNKAHKRKGVVY